MCFRAWGWSGLEWTGVDWTELWMVYVYVGFLSWYVVGGGSVGVFGTACGVWVGCVYVGVYALE
jgi:hypothetical protein